jgi:hypothetical protein
MAGDQRADAGTVDQVVERADGLPAIRIFG